MEMLKNANFTDIVTQDLDKVEQVEFEEEIDCAEEVLVSELEDILESCSLDLVATKGANEGKVER